NDNKVFSRARMLPPAKISTTTISNAIISEGCIINAKLIENSVIGIRTRIGSGTQISKCYVMGSDYYETLEDMKYAMERGVPQLGIGINCLIQNAILDKDCRIGDNVKIRGGDHLPDSDHELYTVKDGIVVVKKAAVLPDNYEIG
ncbi:MAG TPA: glucose-1-phosphate adenylyltransferase, partial [Ginsengibacter sp.]|nr:glucose-1-phosphate adenylyltransferase [Ginsengibacter sp.]